MSRTTLLLLILTCTLYSQPEWQYLSSQNHIKEIAFFNSNTGFAIHGDIIKTTNFGNDWFIVNSGVSFSPNDISFPDPNTGYIAGGNGILIKTTNSGSNWVNVPNSPVSDNRCVFFIDNATGWIGTTQGRIKYTTNGGTSWTLQNITNLYYVKSIFFINSTTGWACLNGESSGSPRIYYTSNSGTNWIIQYNLGINDLRSLWFLNSSTGWCSGANGLLLKTTNGGANWNQVSTGFGGHFNEIKFKDANTGYISASGGLIKTTNSGVNFSQVFSSGSELLSTYIDNSENGFSCGNISTIYRSTNNGINWILTRQGMAGNPYWLQFTSQQTGYVVGQNGLCAKTTTGGNIWTDAPPNTDVSLYTVYFLNDNTGWIAGVAGKIRYTTNGGTNWLIKDASTAAINSIFFLNENTGWAAGDDPIIAKTINNGLSWEYQDAFAFYFRSVYFINENTGWLTGDVDTRKTTNGGTNWIYSHSGSGNTINFISNLGFMGGFSGEAFRSTNYGANWITINTGITSTIQYGRVFDPEKIIAIGGSHISKSTNAGLNWFTNSIPVTSTIQAAYFSDFNTGWAAGTGFYIIKTTNAGSITAVNNTELTVPENYLVCSSYPNPFNPSTTITFNLPVNAEVKLNIYDSSGRLISNLINNKKYIRGTHFVQWDASLFSSGIYFYVLNAENMISSGKMVLLK